jgi:flavorubredoxin
VAQIDEITEDLYRISIYVPPLDLQFNHFLVRDEEPLLFHTGMRRMFPEVRDAVTRLIDPATLRWISWSHFEVDECGALNDWLAIAPKAQAACGQVGALVNLEDFAARPPRGLTREDVIDTGRHRFRWVPTPHLPHGWDAGVLFEERDRVLLCSDLFHQTGQVDDWRSWQRSNPNTSPRCTVRRSWATARRRCGLQAMSWSVSLAQGVEHR